ncbi:MAG: GTPase HflX [Planctomycetes bacterium]|nr:GTPase HflX [Planctomycetota bacterium]MBI3846406.1 GTPase HflX [Planctomycetota bacterium]
MTTNPRSRAVIVGVQLKGVSDAEHESSLDELARLANTLGLEVVARITQKRDSIATAAVVGEGKLREIAALTGGPGAVPAHHARHQKKDDDEKDAKDETPAPVAIAEAKRASVVLVNHDISPRRTRNLELATAAKVLDRTAVILSIFQRHARTREARLQVEIARLSYEAPRLRETGGDDRHGGGIGGKGAGESALQLDRRKIRDRVAELRQELDLIVQEAGTRRQRRAAHDTVALVGYTNAGKSSLMRALTGGDVLVADQLFATLDTTVRALHPESHPRILVSDTVGFIRSLPHDLVASFRSTLEEAREASLLVHVVDAADPAHEAQLEVTRDVLADIGAGTTPTLVLLNKIDRVDEARREELRVLHPDAIQLSAKSPADVAMLRERIISFFEQDMVEEEVVVPFREQRLVAEIHAACRVLSESYDESGTRLRLRARPEVIARLRAEV